MSPAGKGPHWVGKDGHYVWVTSIVLRDTGSKSRRIGKPFKSQWRTPLSSRLWWLGKQTLCLGPGVEQPWAGDCRSSRDWRQRLRGEKQQQEEPERRGLWLRPSVFAACGRADLSIHSSITARVWTFWACWEWGTSRLKGLGKGKAWPVHSYTSWCFHGALRAGSLGSSSHSVGC